MTSLNELTDELNVRLGQAESIFRNRGLGVAAHAPLTEIGPRLELAYMKHDGVWGFFVARQDLETAPTALATTSRETRLVCVQKIRSLWEDYISEERRQAEEMQSAIDQLVDFIRLCGAQ